MIPLPIPTLWIPNFTAHRLGGQRGKKNMDLPSGLVC